MGPGEQYFSLESKITLRMPGKVCVWVVQGGHKASERYGGSGEGAGLRQKVWGPWESTGPWEDV